MLKFFRSVVARLGNYWEIRDDLAFSILNFFLDEFGYFKVDLWRGELRNLIENGISLQL